MGRLQAEGKKTTAGRTNRWKLYWNDTRHGGGLGAVRL